MTVFCFDCVWYSTVILTAAMMVLLSVCCRSDVLLFLVPCLCICKYCSCAVGISLVIASRLLLSQSQQALGDKVALVSRLTWLPHHRHPSKVSGRYCHTLHWHVALVIPHLPLNLHKIFNMYEMSSGRRHAAIGLGSATPTRASVDEAFPVLFFPNKSKAEKESK